MISFINLNKNSIGRQILNYRSSWEILNIFFRPKVSTLPRLKFSWELFQQTWTWSDCAQKVGFQQSAWVRLHHRIRDSLCFGWSLLGRQWGGPRAPTSGKEPGLKMLSPGQRWKGSLVHQVLLLFAFPHSWGWLVSQCKKNSNRRLLDEGIRVEVSCFSEYLFGMALPGLPRGSVDRTYLQCRRRRRYGFDSWVGKIPWRRAWQPTPIFLPGEYTWTEEPIGLQSTGSAKSRTWLSMHAWFRLLTPLCSIYYI